MEPSTQQGKRVRILTQSLPFMATFDFGAAGGDPDKYAELWDAWVESLFLAGMEPAEHPKRWTETTAVYRLFPVDLVTEYGDDHHMLVTA